MHRLLLFVVFAVFVAACGIKGPPRPPLDEVAPPRPALASPRDAGCCTEAK